MPINTNVTNEQITVSVGETQIDVSVNGGVGPTGNAGAAATVTVGTVTTGAPGSSATVVNAGTSSAAVLNFTIPAGATGATGPQGPVGPAGTTTWAGITDKPSTFPPSAHQHVAADISDFTTAVVAAAPPTTNASLLTSGTLPDARLSSNIARTSDVSSAVAALVNSAPATLDTLAELASALGSDANFSTTVTNALAAKAPINNPTFTGTVSGITKSMVGLGNVDNTSDASKPVSTAQAAADAAVASAAAADATSKAGAAQAAAVQRANHTGTQAIGTVDGLQTALDGKAAVSHAHTVSDITGFSEAAQAAAAQRASRLGRNPYYYIPTENEWYKAAYYSPALNSGAGGYYQYATQSNSAPGTTPGSGANQANYANANGGLLDVGSFTNSASYYGTFDQSGNAWEWNDRTGTVGSSRGLRGGIWYNNAFDLSSSSSGSYGPSFNSIGVGFRLASPLNPLSLSNFVTVGNPNNANDSTGYGGVGYTYQIAKYELTNTEYCEFLNAVAATDTYGLLNSGMAITRSGSSGSYTYAPSSGNGNKPVIHITWFRAARYCNWLTNGKPSGSQTVFTTEDGAYTLNGTTSGNAPARNALVTSVAGRTGAVTIAASDITGLATVATSGSAADITSGTLNAARLPATAVSAGSYGSASSVGTFTVDATGRLTAAGSTNIAVSAGAVSGLAAVATSGSYNDLTNKPTIPSAYSLPTATASVLGGVKIGSGISIDGNGVISASSGYTLPDATTSTLGGVIVGAGLSVTSGTVSANVTSVAGRTGAVTIAAADVSGLGTLATQSGTFSGTSSGTNTGDQTITLTGDVTGSGTGAFAATLAASGVTAGTYTSVTVDAKGRVTAGSNPASSGGVKLGLILALT